MPRDARTLAASSRLSQVSPADALASAGAWKPLCEIDGLMTPEPIGPLWTVPVWLSRPCSMQGRSNAVRRIPVRSEPPKRPSLRIGSDAMRRADQQGEEPAGSLDTLYRSYAAWLNRRLRRRFEPQSRLAFDDDARHADPPRVDQRFGPFLLVDLEGFLFVGLRGCGHGRVLRGGLGPDCAAWCNSDRETDASLPPWVLWICPINLTGNSECPECDLGDRSVSRSRDTKVYPGRHMCHPGRTHRSPGRGKNRPVSREYWRSGWPWLAGISRIEVADLQAGHAGRVYSEPISVPDIAGGGVALGVAKMPLDR